MAEPSPWASAANGVTLEVSKPSSGSYFKAGEKAVITVTMKDADGKAMEKEGFSSLSLYMYGPQEPTKTVTAVKLLNASIDRSQRPHHYIDLLNNEDVKTSGNKLTYTLQPITDEEPGTYTVSLRIVQLEDQLNQYFVLEDIQIGTATVEKQVVDREKCAACHQGADNGVFYFHHVDVGRSPIGSPSIDSWPVRTCKSCHNNDGYSAYRLPTNPDTRVPDPIINRVHGVHNGSHLENPISIGSTEENYEGTFADYLDVHFPADVRNCDKCHVDDRYKTEPSRLACGTCHDNIWFGPTSSMPATAEAHPGGPQANDQNCSTCHVPDGTELAIGTVHKIPPPAFKHSIELTMSAPANGKFYVGGESPTVTITLKDAATGSVIDPNTIVEPKDGSSVQPNEWRRANLFVSGPREHTMPVLTTAASHEESDHYYANNDFRVRVSAADEDPRIARSSTAITYQLDDVAGLEKGTYTAFVETMPAAPIGGWAVINFQVGTEEEEAKIATNCTSCHEDTRMHASYFAVQFNPDICKNCHDYERQMPGMVGWSNANNGFGAAPLARRVHGVHRGHYLDKPEDIHGERDAEVFGGIIFPQDIRNCTKCHADNPMWKEEPSRLACNACHDSNSAISHTTLMTNDPTPEDPWNGDEMESCVVCHGPDRDFAVAKMHNITDPYKPPYPREHEHFD